MAMSTGKLGIRDKDQIEIENIRDLLKDLQAGRIQELTGAESDGALSTNIIKLRKMLNDLIKKIDNQSESLGDEVGRLFE